MPGLFLSTPTTDHCDLSTVMVSAVERARLLEQLAPHVDADDADAPPLAQIVIGDEAAARRPPACTATSAIGADGDEADLLLLLAARGARPAAALARDLARRAGAASRRAVSASPCVELAPRLLQILGGRLVGVDAHEVGVGGALVGRDERLLAAVRAGGASSTIEPAPIMMPSSVKRDAPAVGVEGVAHRAQLIDEAHQDASNGGDGVELRRAARREVAEQQTRRRARRPAPRRPRRAPPP